MAKSFESQANNAREGKFARFYKNFNKVSAAVFASAGIITGNEAFLIPMAFDLAQIWAVNRYQEWRGKRKTSSKGIGKIALPGARVKPAHA